LFANLKKCDVKLKKSKIYSNTTIESSTNVVLSHYTLRQPGLSLFCLSLRQIYVLYRINQFHVSSVKLAYFIINRPLQ